jgi:hypothetical protein
MELTYEAHINRIRIITTAKGSRVFIGITRQLLFDPGRWHWSTGAPLMAYSARMGRAMMNLRHQLTRSIPEKWHGTLSMSYQPQWTDVWNKHQPQKDASFLWSVLHYAVAVNSWRTQIAPGIPMSCIRCPASLDETILYRFHHCEHTRLAWQYALLVLYTYLVTPLLNGAWPLLCWQQCLLGSALLRQIQRGRHLWSLFRGFVIWTSWIDRNALCFNEDWPQSTVESMLWEKFLDHGYIAWLHSRKIQKLHVERAANSIRQFDKLWMRSPLFGTRVNCNIQWQSTRPPMGLFY